jgi:hypothetical protein
MLNLGRAHSKTCQAFSRRSFLQVGSLGALGLTFADLLAIKAAQPGATENGRARAVIMLWLWGGPSHLETFDPKPHAPTQFRGPFESIASKVPGVRVGELLPKLAARADKYALIRSMHHQSTDHGVAGTIALTGSIGGAVDLGGKSANGVLQPSTGAIVARLDREKMWSNTATRTPGQTLPPYVILGSQLHQGHKTVVGEGGGLLGSRFDPFRINYEPNHGLKLPDVNLPEGVDFPRLDARWDLLNQVDLSADSKTRQPSGLMIQHYALARNLIASSKSMRALDIDRESPQVRAAYGPHRFGQCCLIARRLVEGGLPFVQVNWSTHVEGPEDAGDGGWDMHDNYFAVMQDRHGWMFDQALSALLDDLESRGLLQSTLVVAIGEFGRTPKVNDKAGRDHWSNCYSALIAGGGVQGGRVVGASDKHAERPVSRPSTPADLGATVLSSLGVTAADLTGIGLTPMGQPIEELF